MNSSLIQRITEKQASQTARDMQHWRRAKQVATRIDLPKRDLLDDLVNDLLYDTHLSSQMELRRDRSLAKPYTILKADGSTDEETTALLSQSGAFSMLMQIALETPFFGHSLLRSYQLLRGLLPPTYYLVGTLYPSWGGYSLTYLTARAMTTAATQATARRS